MKPANVTTLCFISSYMGVINGKLEELMIAHLTFKIISLEPYLLAHLHNKHENIV